VNLFVILGKKMSQIVKNEITGQSRPVLHRGQEWKKPAQAGFFDIEAGLLKTRRQFGLSGYW
jgi:hypothetical protein